MSRDIKITSRYSDGDYLSKNEDWHVADSPWKAKMLKLPKKILYKISLSLEKSFEWDSLSIKAGKL